MARVKMKVDGVTYEDEVEPRLLLAHYLRDKIGLVGTPIGCDTSNCGSCTVLLDGHSVKSCTVLSVQADGAEVGTIQGLAASAEGATPGTEASAGTALHPLQKAFNDHHALQCGYCTPGMIMASVDLLAENPDPSEEEIRHGLEGNLCRCTGYVNIVRAVKQAAGELKGASA